jgi:hypothetical protein
MNLRILLFILAILIACDKRTAEVKTSLDTTTNAQPIDSAAAVVQLTNQAEPVLSDTSREAQFFPKGSTYTVIAAPGTMFRQQPDSAGQVLLRLPYGTPLTVIQRMHYDTLQEPISKVKVPGTWVKMKYKNQEGFVFSADVMSSINYAHEDSVHFFIKGEHCVSNFEFRSDYNYYAVYQKDSLHYELRKVQPAFYVRHEIPQGVDVWEWYNIGTDLGGEHWLVFGLPKILREQEIVSYQPPLYDYYSETDTPDPIHTSRYTISIVRETKDSGWPIPEVVLLNKKGARVQKFVGSRILFCGDLDQDGIADLVYLDSNEKEGGYHLALSSYAEKGMLIKAVGYYQLGYCC